MLYKKVVFKETFDKIVKALSLELLSKAILTNNS
jgi:hypothetical protein